jgi:Tol biopolymer transport system component
MLHKGITTALAILSLSFCQILAQKVDYSIVSVPEETGVEECIISDRERSFTSPVLSPDGQWILFVGSSSIAGNNFNY